MYSRCRLCPRECGADRKNGQLGYCGQTADMRLACAVLHKGEEPPVSGERGSGAFFFSGCTLRCTFCQNRQISHCGMGSTISVEEFAELALLLQEKAAATINIVSGTPFIPGIGAGILLAREKGLHLPVVWNSSGYEKTDSIAELNRWVDVYLPDIKTLDEEIARRYLHAPDYPAAAGDALSLMAASKPLDFENGRICRGTIVRHLALPGHVSATEEVLSWADAALGESVLFSLMFQYTMPGEDGDYLKGTNFPAGSISEAEYARCLSRLDRCTSLDGFVQDKPDAISRLPDFSRTSPFPEEIAEPVWHWRDGFIRDR